MNAVRLEEVFFLGEILEEERNERGAVTLRELGIGRLELLCVMGPIVRRQLHADEHHARARLLRLLDHRAEVLPHLLQRQAAQAVVRAELENQDRRLVLHERLCDPSGATGGGLARDARVDDAIIETLALEALYEQRHP